MNILVVHNYYKLAGGEDVVAENEADLLKIHGHNVTMYTRHNKEMDSFSIIQKLFLPFSTIFSIKSYKEVKKILKDNHIDIMHVHNTLNMISPSVYYAAFSLNIPVVQTMHNFRLMCPGASFYRNGKICEDCCSKGLACSIIHGCYRSSRLQTIASATTLVIHRLLGTYKKLNYIALTEFNKNKLLKVKGINKNKVYIKANFTNECNIVNNNNSYDYFIFAGRLEKIKGIDVLLKAWKKLGNTAPKLLICGTGELENKCKSYVNKYNISSVQFLGQKDHNELISLMAFAKAVILPSQWYETFALVVAEGYSVSTPALAGDIGNGGDRVVDGITGFKFIYNSPDSLADSVKRINQLSNEEYQAMRENAKHEYEKFYSPEKNYQALINIYRNITGEAPSEQ